jgi:hypothetical protein
LLLIAFALLFAAGMVLGLGGVALYRRDRGAARDESAAGAAPGETRDEAANDAPSSTEDEAANDQASASQSDAEDGP